MASRLHVLGVICLLAFSHVLLYFRCVFSRYAHHQGIYNSGYVAEISLALQRAWSRMPVVYCVTLYSVTDRDHTSVQLLPCRGCVLQYLYWCV